jgi:hypothetical protein
MDVFETRESIAECVSAEELHAIQARLQGEMDLLLKSFGTCIAARETKGAMSAVVRLKYFSKVSAPPFVLVQCVTRCRVATRRC